MERSLSPRNAYVIEGCEASDRLCFRGTEAELLSRDKVLAIRERPGYDLKKFGKLRRLNKEWSRDVRRRWACQCA